MPLKRQTDGERLAIVETKTDAFEDIVQEIKDTLKDMQKDLALVKADVADMNSKAKGGWFVLCTIGAVVVGLVGIVASLWHGK